MQNLNIYWIWDVMGVLEEETIMGRNLHKHEEYFYAAMW